MSAISGRRLERLLLPAVIVTLVGFLIWYRQPGALTLTTVSGETITLPDERGPVLLNFWATGCPACLEEIPELERLYRKYHPKGLRIVAVAMPYDPPNRVVAFVKRRRPPYPVALDPSGRISATFQVRLIPTWILLGSDARILWRHHTGIPDTARLETLLQRHLERG